MLHKNSITDQVSKRWLSLAAAVLLLALPLVREAGAGVVQLPKTGQKTCYDSAGTEIPCAGTRQDGELQMGLAPPSPRFTDHNDGTVTDNLTGLIWLKQANCFGPKLWMDAMSLAKDLHSGTCGLSDNSVAGDWRLPNILELESLVDISNINPALPTGHPFSSVQNSGYLSSTTNAFHPLRARYVYFPDGAVNGASKTTEPHFVWPVRGRR
ncbi:Lcl C-terminal domain-containing protein [Geomonas anaerohicana]|uniref:DUF1566 domain-containing protein n=1 Tax=Geomonas anaerohicana TaxID=2798583 RepID=A0ABS0YIN5_9BACT|nr:DUF1566 domain-containing protein [Geomonas anaerohicana]MBJ6752135.1 DUF1566 domain-containing protein [Geomonas anaerohicana]